MTEQFDISRRKALAALGTIGVASAGAGLGTSAYFSDQETFDNNQLTAGTLDLGVGYSAHYSDWSDEEDEGVPNVRMYPGDGTGGVDDLEDDEVGLPANAAWLIAVSDDDPDDDGRDGDVAAQFLDNTQYDSYNDGGLDCPLDDTDQADGIGRPVIDLDDVKPGDFGEVTFDFTLCDNPGYVWLQGELVSCAENGTTEPEADDPDEASLLPLAAVGGASASAIKDGVQEKVAGAVSGDGDNGVLNRKNALRAATAGAGGAAGLGAMTGAASAAVGDELAAVDLENNGNCSVAATWDGTYFTTMKNSSDCASSLIQISEPPAGGTGTATLVAEKSLVDGQGNPVEISALEWDPVLEKYWGGYDGTTYLIERGDPTDGTQDAVVEDSFDSSDPHGFGIVDGLAIDAEECALWYSPDVDTQVVKYDISSGNRGALLADIEPKDQNGNVAGDISGVAFAAPLNGRKTLYVGQNPGPANGNILRVYADTGEYITNFATGTEFRVEDITCAPNIYDSEAILVKDSDRPEYKAFEVEQGTCPLSGGGDGGDGGDGQCPDVELLDVVQAAAWVDDGNNYQNGDESPEVSGSLRSVLTQLASGNGVGLSGDISAEEGGGTGRDCFSSGDGEDGTTHSVAFAWWVPTDHGNEIQTDSVTFDLSFYTEQCRHNDGSGMNNAMVNNDEVDDT